MTNNQVKETFFQYMTEKEMMMRADGRKLSQTDIRTAFCEYVDMLCKDGEISEEQAQYLTL